MPDYTSTSKQELVEGWEQFVTGFASWKWFVTLTFRDIVTNDQLEHQFRFLVQCLNRDLFGNHYTRIVGHSYFSYAMGIEAQRRGALHAHLLIDQNINLNILHPIWNKMAGFAWAVPVDDVDRAVNYLSKYISKGGDLSLYRPAQVKVPAFQPSWYNPTMINLHKL